MDEYDNLAKQYWDQIGGAAGLHTDLAQWMRAEQINPKTPETFKSSVETRRKGIVLDLETGEKVGTAVQVETDPDIPARSFIIEPEGKPIQLCSRHHIVLPGDIFTSLPQITE